MTLKTIALSRLATSGLIMLMPLAADASEIGAARNVGVGVLLGQPTGLDVKIYLSRTFALEAAFGFGYLGGSSLQAHLDGKFTLGMLANNSSFELPIYLGIGAKLIWWAEDLNRHYWLSNEQSGRVGVGVRVPFGIAFQLHKAPVDVSLEIAPGAGFVPGIGAFLDGGLGIRYWF